jgi:hypothetical protein
MEITIRKINLIKMEITNGKINIIKMGKQLKLMQD